MIKNDAGEKVSALTKTKIELKKYLEAFTLSEHVSDFSDLKKTEPSKLQVQVNKMRERFYKKLVIK